MQIDFPLWFMFHYYFAGLNEWTRGKKCTNVLSQSNLSFIDVVSALWTLLIKRPPFLKRAITDFNLGFIDLL